MNTVVEPNSVIKSTSKFIFGKCSWPNMCFGKCFRKHASTRDVCVFMNGIRHQAYLICNNFLTHSHIVIVADDARHM